MRRLTELISKRPRLPALLGDFFFALSTAAMIVHVLGLPYMNSPNLPTGGDAASHLLYTWLYEKELLFSGQIVPWVPETFGGTPFLSYYFPLPFILIASLAKFIGLAAAFKWGSFLAAILLPGAVYTASRRWLNFSWPAAFFSGLGALAFISHEQHSIWGGNLLSTLAGEFAYSYGVFFAVLAMMAWVRAINSGRGWFLAALLEAASGFSHGFPLLIQGFSTAFFLVDMLTGRDRARLKSSFFHLFYGHALAFGILGGWLWPLLEMHRFTIPNDASFALTNRWDLFPETLWPSTFGGLIGIGLLFFSRARQAWCESHRRAACYFVSAAGLSVVAFIGGDKLGLADIRFFPLVWIFGVIACGWALGQSVTGLMALRTTNDFVCSILARALLVIASGLFILGWVAQHINTAPEWGLWNHSGLEAKPQWNNLRQLFPFMQGNLWSPRLAVEHDPANEDIGSTRTMEALPMFLNQRPVLEGLYMESALLGPAIYQVQSEISARPSSPLVRFPCGSLDPQFAARHLNMLHANSILLRSTIAKAAIEESGLFDKIAESQPFALYQLKNFDSHLAQVVTQPMRSLPAKDWMQDSFTWFRTRSRFDLFLPVYGNGKEGVGTVPMNSELDSIDSPVREKTLSRSRMVFETQAIGRPHLIKIAYHPRWHLESKGTLQIAGPGFMLVTPDEPEIRLVYGHTPIGLLGGAATLLILIGLFIRLFRGCPKPPSAHTHSTLVSSGRFWVPITFGWSLLFIAGCYLRQESPERVYNQAWERVNASDHAGAAAHFLRAYNLRKPPAKKEEALFWLAKSLENSGQRTASRERYLELIERYHGYWLPEALYTYISLSKDAGGDPSAAAFERRLRDEYPNNKWTLKLDE